MGAGVDYVDSLLRQAPARSLSEPGSHQIVLVSPGTSRDAFESSFPTRYIYEKCRDSLSNHKLEAAARLYDMCRRVRNPWANAGFMLEDAVSDVFFKGGEEACQHDEVKPYGSKVYTLEGP